MEELKNNLAAQFIQRYGENATPTIVAISQDITKPKRKENKPGTDQNTIMMESMMSVYQIARFKFESRDYFDCSNLKYTMAPATAAKWQ